jgi:starch-binding outer membrane protein, SusD/RagB family
MKKIILNISIVSCLLVLSTSCEKFLDLQPIDTPTETTFYVDESGLQAGAIAMYDGLQADEVYGANMLSLAEVRGDNVMDNNPGGGGGLRYQIETFSETSANTNLSDCWYGLYKTIYRSNIILDRAPDIKMDEARKKQIIGQAAFVRSLCYFDLVRLFGKVPLVTSVQTAEQARANRRATVEAIYTQIITDLNTAMGNLPTSWPNSEYGKANSYAATALLGKVYLYQKKYSEAASALLPLVTAINAKTSLSLVPQTTTFPNGIKTSKDIIFAIYYLSGGIGESANINNRYRNQDNGNAIILPQSLFENGDNRKALIAPTGSGVLPGKFNSTTSGTECNGDFPVLRCADVMLMYAEALNEVSYPSTEAFAALNAVRTNAGVTSLAATDAATKTDFRTAVYKERRLELALECDRWFDIVRTGQMASVNPLVQPFRVLYPVPQVEIDNINDKTDWQNTGY